MAGTNRIVKLGLEKRASTLRSSIDPVYSIRDIARILTDESGKTIKFQSVQRYFEALSRPPAAPIVAVTPGIAQQQQDPTAVREQRQAEIREAAAQGRLDAVQQLRDINTETREILEQLKGEDGKFINSLPGRYLALAAIQRIEKQLELQAKLLGDIPTQPQVNITLVENQFNEFKAAVVGVMCPECQRRLAELLRSRMEQ